MTISGLKPFKHGAKMCIGMIVLARGVERTERCRHIQQRSAVGLLEDAVKPMHLTAHALQRRFIGRVGHTMEHRQYQPRGCPRRGDDLRHDRGVGAPPCNNPLDISRSLAQHRVLLIAITRFGTDIHTAGAYPVPYAERE
jgi:hypothetical protein